MAFKADGFARGTSALVSTGDGKSNNMLIRSKVTVNYSISRGRSADMYPSSQFGIIALLRQRSSFLTNMRKAIKYGLPEAEALKALTTTPADMIGATDLVGAVKKGMLANLLITSGSIFSDECVLYENWVQGVPYRIVDLRTRDLRGTYAVKIDTSSYKMILSGTFDKPVIKLLVDSTEIRGASFILDKDLVSISFDRLLIKFRLSGYISGKDLEGKGLLDNGRWISCKASWDSNATEPDSRTKRPTPPIPTPGLLIYPFTPYGSAEIPKQEDVLFKNATVWTCEKEGNLPNTDVLVQKGKITKIGKSLSAEGIKVIDASGMHLTPGIIDEHSHIALDATNEGGQAITSEIRAGDVVDPEDITLYRQLAGGVTAAHILHGSANPIGGQSVIIKHRWGHSAEELKVDNQPGFLKHALGENVKRSTSRYPNTRMGSIKVGKDADLVLWTDNPLSIYARASKTMVDGTIYFNEAVDAKLKEQIDAERNRIIGNVLRESQSATTSTSNFPRR